MTKILLVEDDKSLREIYGVRLLAEGYDIVSAGDGEEALAMAIKERPQLIISDVMMPKISGFDMLDILRSTTETKDIKVIMMTALSSEDQRTRGEQLGADRYLVKSQVGIEDVVRTVHEVLGDAPVAAAGGASLPPRSTPPAQPNPSPASPPTPPRPAPAPTPQPEQRPPQPAPAASPNPSNSSSGLPQPTAPFSTQRPANLGERVIHPPEKPDNEPDMAAMLDRELSDLKETPEFSSPSTVEPLAATQPPAQSPPAMPTAPLPPQPPTSMPNNSAPVGPQAPTTPAPNQPAPAQQTPPQPSTSSNPPLSPNQ